MHLAKVLADHQAKSNALVVHLVHIFELPKFLEQKLLVFLANSNPRVLNLDQDATLLFDVCRIDLDKAVFVSELESILDQVYHHLLQAHLVSNYSSGEWLAYVVDELFIFNLSMPLEHEVDILNDFMEWKGTSIEIKCSLFYLSQIEQIIDKTSQKLKLKLDVVYDVFFVDKFFENALNIVIILLFFIKLGVRIFISLYDHLKNLYERGYYWEWRSHFMSHYLHD